MKCASCGAEVQNNAKFCSECGAALTVAATGARASRKQTIDTSKVNAERVTLYPDGKYRWVYEYPMMRNPVLLFSMLKIFGLCAAAPALVVFIAELANRGLISAVKASVPVCGLVAVIMCVLTLIGYTIVAAGYGWKYVVVFVMDEHGIDHVQQKKQFKKAEVIGIVTALAGAASHNVGRVGQGMMVSSHSSISSNFHVVRKIKGYPHSNVIKVNSLFSKNQIYMKDEDYDFVWNYITARCPNAKVY